MELPVEIRNKNGGGILGYNGISSGILNASIYASLYIHIYSVVSHDSSLILRVRRYLQD